MAAIDPTLSQEQNNAEQHHATYDALVLDAILRQSLVTVRSLGRRGLHVAASEVANVLDLEQLRRVPTFSSRWCQHAYTTPAYVQDTEPFLTYLQGVLATTGARVLITSSDGTLAVIRKHRKDLEQCGARVALAAEPALAVALHKDQTLAVAKHMGVDIPRGVIVRSVREVIEAIHEIGLPAVVKPIETWQWGAQSGKRLVCKLVTTPAEALLAIEELTQFGVAVHFQQFLPGRREAVSFLYAHGKMHARFAQWAKRTHPQLGGTSVYRQSIALPADIHAQAERLVREIGLEGYSEVEFRRDAAGKPFLMEINPRLSASVEVAVRAGVDFPYLLYQWAAGEPIQTLAGYRTGRWMRYLEGDLLTTIQAFSQRGRPGVTPPRQALLEFLAAFFVPGGYDYVDWQDLCPAWAALSEFTERVLRKLAVRIAGRRTR
jgi:predicted ATP-grasp superfamily ATP-dependent carboligase